MKKLGGIILVSLFAIFAIADLVYDFIKNDSVQYFSESPHKLLLVATIAILGGLVALFFVFLDRLSPHWQRRVKLVTLGSAATFVTVGGGFFGCLVAGLSVFSGQQLALGLLAAGAAAAVLWFEFYQSLKSRV